MSDSNSTLTAARLRELLDYNQETGAFTWRKNVSSTGRHGEMAGCANRAGYIVIRVEKRLYTAHRLAYLHVNGSWPTGNIDHIDMNKSNNQWRNLRPASKSENGQNKRAPQKNGTSGFLGVYWSKRQQAWGAKAVAQGKQHHGGFHATPELAHAAYIALKRKVHPFGTL